MTDAVCASAEPARPAKRGEAWRKEIPHELKVHAREGMSRAEIAAEMGYTLERFDEWERSVEVFRKAMAEARSLALAWWERQGRLGVKEGKLNATLWAKNVAGRFPEIYGERAQAPAARKAGKGARAARPITDRDRAKALALLMSEHPDAFERLGLPTPAALAAARTRPDGDPSEG